MGCFIVFERFNKYKGTAKYLVNYEIKISPYRLSTQNPE